MHSKIADAIFTMEHFFDEISIIDMDGIIQYCKIFTPDTYSFTADEIIGKHIFEVFTSSNRENSEIYQVLKTGKPIAAFEENCITYKGDRVKGYSSVYPIFEGKRQVGAAIALKFFGSEYTQEFIRVQNKTATRSKGRTKYNVNDIITNDPEMLILKEKLWKVRDADSAVLIEGETGTGKEIVAQSLHYCGKRRDKSFVSVNCSSIPENLLESTLFGTEKGSFTGAVTRKGLFELADEGTLFLDELNSMPLHLQGKLLKTIEEKSVRHLGGHEEKPIDVRIIAAINEDPFMAMEKGRLRDDLFYRLNVISFFLPRLKARKGDVKLLTDYYISLYNENMGKNVKGLTVGAMRLFEKHDWPGNVRELKNVIEGAMIIAENEYMHINDLPAYLRRCQDAEQKNLEIGSLRQRTEAFERQVIESALAANATKKEAAELLGMTKQALNYKMDALKMK